MLKINLKILSWDAQSVMKEKKKPYLEYCQEHEIDVICIQETWLQLYINLIFKGHNMIRKDRSEGTKGEY